MQLIRGFYNLPNHSVLTNGCVLSIGNFDGVHLGHQQILARLINKAIELGLNRNLVNFLQKKWTI